MAAKHQPLADLILKISQEGSENGLPPNLVFADSGHNIPEVPETMGSPEVVAALKQGGWQRFNTEVVKPHLYEAYLSGKAPSQSNVEFFRDMIRYSAKHPEIHGRITSAYGRLLDEMKNNSIPVSFPDVRWDGITYEQIIEQSRNESKKSVLEKALEHVSHMNCGEIQMKTYLEVLPEEKDRFLQEMGAPTSLLKPIQQMLDPQKELGLIGTDHATVARTQADGLTSAQVYLWGGAHMIGDNDLDEAADAKTIVIMDAPGSSAYSKLYAENYWGFDFPDYAYYAQEGRVVKLENPASKEEFLYGAAGKTEFKLSPEQEKACKDAVLGVLIGLSESPTLDSLRGSPDELPYFLQAAPPPDKGMKR